MKKTYFNAISLIDKPFISWQSVGSFTPTEFATSEYADDPLVIPEDEIPFPYSVFGVCPKKIVAGVLEDRTPAEMAVFETEYNIVIGLKSDAARIVSINNDKFTYDGNEFPMDEVSRLFYETMAKLTAVPYKIRTMENTEYALEAANIVAFLEEYYKKLITISKHTL